MTVKKAPTFTTREPSGYTCVHCQRRCGTLTGGFARVNGNPVCSRPTEPGRPDCYRMVMMKFHPLHDCPECMDDRPHIYPPPPRGLLGSHII